MPSLNVKCPKCCPKQCANCPSPAVICDDMPTELMNQFVKSAVAEAKSSHLTKFCQDGSISDEESIKIPLTLPVAIKIIKNWYKDASFEAEDALYDIKCIWNSAEGEFSRKLCATNRLFIYYLLILAIYIIQTCFSIDEALFEGLCRIIASKDKKRNSLE